jgi:predicted MFS family arabinose efflux permease
MLLALAAKMATALSGELWTLVCARFLSGLPQGAYLGAATVLLAGFGAWSFSVLGVWTKLTFTYSLDFWDFTASVTPFFGHWAT